MVQNHAAPIQTTPVQVDDLTAWRLNRAQTEKHQEDVNRQILRQLSH